MRITLTGSSAEQKTKFTLASSFQLAPLSQIKFCQKKDGDVFEKSAVPNDKLNSQKIEVEIESNTENFWNAKAQKKFATKKELLNLALEEFFSAKKEFLGSTPQSFDFQTKKEKYLQARENLFCHQKPIIDWFVDKEYKRNAMYKNPMLAKDELQSIAYLSWAQAETKFDPSLSQSFNSYIFNRIGWDLRRYAMENASPVYLSKAQIQALRYDVYKKFQEATDGQIDFLKVTPEKISETVGCSPRNALLAQRLTLTRFPRYSLDSEKTQIETFIKNTLKSTEPQPSEVFEDNEAKVFLDIIFENLPKGYKTKYLEKYFELHNIQKVAEEMNISRAAVHHGVMKGLEILALIMKKPDTSCGNVAASLIIFYDALKKNPQEAKKIFAEEVEKFLSSRSATDKYSAAFFKDNPCTQNLEFFNKNEILVKTAQRFKKLL